MVSRPTDSCGASEVRAGIRQGEYAEQHFPKKARMSTQCIHGFLTDQCVSCRTSPHGQMASNCVRRRATLAARPSSKTPVATHPSEEHAGFEIFFEPAVSGWRYRGPDEAASPLSYRSAFLARKAVDQLPEGGTPVAASKKASKKNK